MCLKEVNMLRPVNIMKVLYCANNLLSISRDKCLQNKFIQLRPLKLTTNCKFNEEVSTDESTAKQRKKTVRIPKITLENIDGSMSIVLLEEATKIAKRHNMFLIKMPYIDTKGSRDVYKIVDYATYINDMNTEKQIRPEGNIKEKSNNKSTKNFTISPKISQHDLDTKLNNINKLLIKNHVIRIIINSSGNNKNKEELIQHIKKKIEGTKVTETIKGDNAILTYAPQKNKNHDENDT